MFVRLWGAHLKCQRSVLLHSNLLFFLHSVQQGQSLERRCPSCQRPTSRSTETASPVRSSLSEATPTSPSTSTSATSHGPSRSRWGFGTRLTTRRTFIFYQSVSVYQTTAPTGWPYCNRENGRKGGAAVYVMQNSGWFQVHLIVITRLMSDAQRAA